MKHYRYQDPSVCAKCGRPKDDLTKVYCSHCRAGNNERSRQHYLKQRDQIFEAYGGYICVCCGETLKTMLTLDHINNDGYKDRGARGVGDIYGRNFYQQLIREKFPSGLQVLCANCNTSKMRNLGQCEHKG